MIHQTPKLNLNKGFTLLEMLAVLAIFGILTSIFVGNYSKMTSDVVLTNMAYELALSVREAQVYGIAVTNQESAKFGEEYGISFSPNLPSYFLFADSGTNNNIFDDGATCTGDECKKTYTLLKGTMIGQLKVNSINSSLCNDVDQLSILFQRPNPEPLINNAEKNFAQIELISRDKDKQKYVIVSSNGQIYVTSEPKCPEI